MFVSGFLAKILNQSEWRLRYLSQLYAVLQDDCRNLSRAFAIRKTKYRLLIIYQLLVGVLKQYTRFLWLIG